MGDNLNRGYEQLIDKLDAFTRKYYTNQLLRGALYATGLVLVFYLSVVLLEHYAEFGTAIRTVIFYGFVLVNGYVIIKLIAIPVFKLYKLGEVPR